jgi:hypothetical protein
MNFSGELQPRHTKLRALLTKMDEVFQFGTPSAKFPEKLQMAITEMLPAITITDTKKTLI